MTNIMFAVIAVFAIFGILAFVAYLRSRKIPEIRD